MVRQYRNAIDNFTLEIPAGSKDKVRITLLVPLENVRKKQAISPGCKHLVDVHTTVAFSNELIRVYYSTNLVASKQQLDEDEYIDIERHSLDDLVSMIFAGNITDAKTIAALLAYKTKIILVKASNKE